MQHIEKVVVRFNTGEILKGYLMNFKIDESLITIEEAETKLEHSILIDDLKAIFFVKTFEGDSKHRDKKIYGIRKNIGRKVYIRFNDGEPMVGFLEGGVPWERGFFISKADSKNKGFFLIPVDSESNNMKVFVVGSSIKDITILP